MPGYDNNTKDKYGLSINDYKTRYAEAQARGDSQGMAAANAGANAIRQLYGDQTVDASNAINMARNGTSMSIQSQQDNGYDTGYAGQNQNGQQNPTQPVKPEAYNPNNDTAYQQAIAALTNVQKNAPQYNPTYDAQIQDLYDRIVNREKFQYDIDSDMLYRQYAKKYVELGNLAMQDTMGQTAALTGGYGSTYGQAVGQQQYDAYLQRLNDIVPELYDRAYGQYQDEGNALLQQYAMLGDLADDEYGKYQDQYNMWLKERDYQQALADAAYNRGQNAWAAQMDQYNNEMQMQFNQNQADREYYLALEKWQHELDQDAAKAAGKSGGSGGGGGYDYSPVTNPTANPTEPTEPTEPTVDQKKVNPVNPLLNEESPKVKRMYTMTELLDAAAAGMTKAQIEATLKARGVDISSAAVQADIKYALSR